VKKFIFKLILIFLVVLLAWFFIIVNSNNGLSKNKTFLVQDGQGVNQISNGLYNDNLIKSKFVFESWLWIKQAESKLIAGVYDIPAGVSIRQLTNLLILGPQDSQESVTLLEGWTRKLMSEALDRHGMSGQKFMELSSEKIDWQDDYDFLLDAPSNASLEGYIFPDTYFIDSSTSEEFFIKKTLNNFNRKLSDSLREEINRQGKTIFEVVTLASIIEREVPVYADKKMIADVFLKRIDAGIGLQSDATINYITGKGMEQPTLDDLTIDSPYNTYKYKGLPPGPISNPGIDSIEAVVYPTANEYYYFLTSDDDKVIYSRTYEEHLENKARYLD